MISRMHSTLQHIYVLIKAPQPVVIVMNCPSRSFTALYELTERTLFRKLTTNVSGLDLVYIEIFSSIQSAAYLLEL